MAEYRHDQPEPFIAASAMSAFVPVFMPLASSRDNVVVPLATNNVLPIGFTHASVASAGDPVQINLSGRSKAIAAASFGAGAEVGVASTNGALGPLLPSGVLPSFGASAGLQLPRFVLGFSPVAQAAGDVFTVILRPRQII